MTKDADRGENAQAPDWKQRHANSAEKALSHPLVTDVVDELLRNLGEDRAGLVFYGIMKVAMVTASVTLAQARGIDPDALRLTPEESARRLMERGRRIAEAGGTVLFVEPTEDA